MSDLLQLADMYYAVARDLQGQGQRLIEMADMLGKMADQMSEENMRRQKPGGEGDGND